MVPEYDAERYTTEHLLLSQLHATELKWAVAMVIIVFKEDVNVGYYKVKYYS